MPVRGVDFGVQPDLAAMLLQPARAGVEIGVVLGLRGDAGEAEVFAKLREKTLLVLLQVVKDGLHPKRLMISGQKHKLGNFSVRRVRNGMAAFAKCNGQSPRRKIPKRFKGSVSVV